ncbi:MAG: protein kinase, partial [Pseudomonadales bacterium]|nr:protein kinase [Pseudomonadales bacterium]
MSDEDRRTGPEEGAGEADRPRRSSEAEDADRDVDPARADGAAGEDTTLMRERPRAPQDVDDDETTEFLASKRDGPADRAATTQAADASDSREDTTQIRDGRGEGASTAAQTPTTGEGADETRQRAELADATTDPGRAVGAADPAPGGDDEATAVNLRTQSMPAVGRTSLGPAPDAPRLKNASRGTEATGATDATYLRDAPDAAVADATRLRAKSLPGDDEETVVGADLRDDDATVQSPHVPPPEDDATIPPGRRSAAGDDDDLTVPSAGALDAVGPAARDAGTATSSQVRAAKEIGPGTVLKGRFTLEDKLGAGGMGGVYRAVDLLKKEARDRRPYVAVKVLNEAFAEHEDSFLALQRESSRSQRLTHPNIAAVYDFDRDGDTAYMVMELLEGSPLDSFLKKKRGGLSPDRAREVIRDISSALAYAHTQTPALVHSDFKPGNIFYTDDGAAKVFDFGIARAAVETSGDVGSDMGMDLGGADTEDEDRTLFDAGKLGALTPAYASLEMFEGRDPAPQDDVYALGIVAYQCFTGRHPFDRQKAPIAAAQGMVPERPEGVTSREWRAIRHALEFKREDRTPNAQAFLEEFFHTGTRTLLAVAATAATMAVGIAALYFTGVIGPRAPTPNPNQDWVALQSEIRVAREAVRDQLDTGAAGFERNDGFVAWEQGVRSSIEDLARVSAPTIRVVGSFDDEASALRERDRIFALSGAELSLVVRSDSATGPWHLEAGPFRFLSRVQLDAELAKTPPDPRARAYAERRTLEEFVAGLEAIDVEHSVLTDDARIDGARYEALQAYLREVDRRLRDVEKEIEPIEPRLLHRGAVVYRDGTETPLAPGDPQVDALLDEGAVWIADQDELAEWAAAEVALEQAGLDEEESLLARARSRYARALAQSDAPTAARAAADIETRRRAVQARYAELEAGRQAATVAASALQTAYNTAKTNAERVQRRREELRAVLKAHLDGGAVEIDAAYGQLGRSDAFTFVTPGLKPAFRLECTQPLVVARALADYAALPGLLDLQPLRGEALVDADRERLVSLQYLSQCMKSVIRASSQGEETITLDLPRAVAGNPAPRLLEGDVVRVDLGEAGAVDIAVREGWIFDCPEGGLCMLASDAIFLTRDVVLGTLAHVGEAPSAE